MGQGRSKKKEQEAAKAEILEPARKLVQPLLDETKRNTQELEKKISDRTADRESAQVEIDAPNRTLEALKSKEDKVLKLESMTVAELRDEKDKLLDREHECGEEIRERERDLIVWGSDNNREKLGLLQWESGNNYEDGLTKLQNRVEELRRERARYRAAVQRIDEQLIKLGRLPLGWYFPSSEGPPVNVRWEAPICDPEQLPPVSRTGAGTEQDKMVSGVQIDQNSRRLGETGGAPICAISGAFLLAGLLGFTLYKRFFARRKPASSDSAVEEP